MEDNIDLLLNNVLMVFGKADISELDHSTIDFFIEFNKLPRNEQIKMLNTFVNTLKFYKRIHSDEENQLTCEKSGHIYGEWYESVSFKCYKGSSFKNKIWCKKCARCGNIEMTFVKPRELVKIEEEHRLESEIDVLQRKLVKLRGEK